MTEREAQLDKKLSEAFAGGGIRRRELRLTGEEAAYIRAHFAAVVLPMEPEEGKSWYEITFRGAEN